MMRISTTDAEPTVTTTYETAQLNQGYWDARTADLRSAVMAKWIVYLTVDFLNRVDGAFLASPQRPVTRGSPVSRTESSRVTGVPSAACERLPVRASRPRHR